jgi:hypothetical protein
VPFSDWLARKRSIELRGNKNGATDATAAKFATIDTSANLGDRQAKGPRRLVDSVGVLAYGWLQARHKARVKFGFHALGDRLGKIVEQCGQDVAHGKPSRAPRQNHGERTG